MVVIHTRSGKYYQFAGTKAASVWMKNFPELYDNDLNNIAIYSDRHLKDTIHVHTSNPHDVEKIIVCDGCQSNLKFTVEPHDHTFTVKCPACHTSHILSA